MFEFTHDGMVCRVQKRTNNVTAGNDTHTRYVYDGRNVVAEFTLNNPPAAPACSTMRRSSFCGLDVAHSFGTTGGVDAPVQITGRSMPITA